MNDWLGFTLFALTCAAWYLMGRMDGQRKERVAARERAHRAFLNGMGMGVAMMADRPSFVGESGPIAEIADALDRRGEAEATQSVNGPRIVEES